MENPYSTENKYTLDLLSHYVYIIHPNRVRIATDSVEMAKSIARRLFCESYELLVENSQIQEAIFEGLGIRTLVRRSNSTPADAAVFPFSFPDRLQPEKEPAIIVACLNAFSYKNLIYPGIVKNTVYTTLSKLTADYTVSSISSLYSPQFIFWWTLAKLVENLNSACYFRLEDLAMQRIIHFGPLWRFSYIVVFTGQIAS